MDSGWAQPPETHTKKPMGKYTPSELKSAASAAPRTQLSEG